MNYFSKFFGLLFIIFLFSKPSFSYNFNYIKDIEVGSQPVGVFYDNVKQQFHIFCVGADRDFDGEFEPSAGDSLPSWWILKVDISGNVTDLKRVKEFAFGSIPFPFRPAFVPDERKIFINHFDGIVAYNLDTFEEVEPKIKLFGVNGLDYRSGHLLISQSQLSGLTDTALVYSVNSKKIMNKYPIGKNLMFAKMFQPFNPDFKGIAAISVGNFGSDSSRLHRAIFNHFEVPTFSDTLIGNTANSIDVVDDRFLVIPVLMSNTLVLADLRHDFYFTFVPLGEPSWDGPTYSRFIKVSEKNKTTEYLILTTTYAGFVEIYKLFNEDFPVGGSSKELTYVTQVDLTNKGESLDFAIISNNLIQVVVASSLKPDYSPNNTVSLINIDYLTNVKNEQESPSSFIVRENEIEYIGEIQDNSIFTIYDINGKNLISVQGNNKISISNLNNGTYFAKIIDGKNVYLFKFLILNNK